MEDIFEITTVTSARVSLLQEEAKKNGTVQDVLLRKVLDPNGELAPKTVAQKISNIRTLAEKSRKKISAIKNKNSLTTNRDFSKNKDKMLLILQDLSIEAENFLKKLPYESNLGFSQGTLEILGKIKSAQNSGELGNFSNNADESSLKKAIVECVTRELLFQKMTCYASLTEEELANVELSSPEDEEKNYVELSELTTAVILDIKDKYSQLKDLSDETASDIANFGLELDLVCREAIKNRWSWGVLFDTASSLVGGIFTLLIATVSTGATQIFLSVIAAMAITDGVIKAYRATFPAGFSNTMAGQASQKALHETKKYLLAVGKKCVEGLGGIIIWLGGILGLTVAATTATTAEASRNYSEQKNQYALNHA